MIKIRYSDLPQGRHAHVHTAGRRPVIYLLPGLSPAQRRDALGRLIRTSRQGYGPRLRAPGVRFAVARDVTKTTARNALAAVRCHPAGSTALAALIAAGVICYAFFVTVTVRFTPHPAGPPVAAPSGPQVPGGRSPGSGASGPAGTQPPVTGRRTASARHGRAPAPAPELAPGLALRRRARRPIPCRCPPAPGQPRGVCCRPARPSRRRLPHPRRPPRHPRRRRRRRPASPAPRRGDPGGLCLQLGPLGVCLSG